MSLLDTLENRAASWAFRRFALRALQHWKTSLGGVITLLGALSGLLQYLLHAADTGQIDLNALLTYFGGISAGIGLLAAKDAGSHDLALDPAGRPIPRATIVS